jgi:hypothetical protein
MQTPQIIQHNLDPEWQDAVEWALTGASHFPWQFQTHKSSAAEPQPWNSQFVHQFYQDGVIVTPFWEMIEPLIDVIDPLSIIRVKANLTVATENRQYHEWHSDSDDSRLTTAIYYANTNNGATEFISGDVVESQKGQLVIFPANMDHRVWTHTDVQARAVINFIYLAKN